MTLPGPVRAALLQQAEACRGLGSPFTAHLCQRLAAILDDTTVLGRAVCGWTLDPVESALALRLCGALHMTVRAGRAPALARLYPPAEDMGAALDAALHETIMAHGDDLVRLLDSAPQTNEVARSAVLLGGLLTIAAQTGLPLALNEIGTSAGVNLHPDCYGYDLGAGRGWGPPDAPLTIACDWRGAAPPLDAPLRIVSRAGADLAPIDAADVEARERVLAYIWPDQPARLARTASGRAGARRGRRLGGGPAGGNACAWHCSGSDAFDYMAVFSPGDSRPDYRRDGAGGRGGHGRHTAGLAAPGEGRHAWLGGDSSDSLAQ
jgi:hypothetical protein